MEEEGESAVKGGGPFFFVIFSSPRFANRLVLLGVHTPLFDENTVYMLVIKESQPSDNVVALYLFKL